MRYIGLNRRFTYLLTCVCDLSNCLISHDLECRQHTVSRSRYSLSNRPKGDYFKSVHLSTADSLITLLNVQCNILLTYTLPERQPSLLLYKQSCLQHGRPQDFFQGEAKSGGLGAKPPEADSIF